MKKLLTLLCVFLLGLGLIACNTKNDTSESGESDDITISVTNSSVVYDGFIHYPTVNVEPSDAGDVEFKIFSNGELVNEAKVVGSYSIEVSVVNDGNVVATKTVDFKIEPKEISLSALQLDAKEYDGSNTYSTTYRIVGNGVLSGEVVYAEISGTLNGKDVGDNYVLTADDLVLSGAEANNYKVVSTENLTASIVRKQLMISGITVKTKAYDGTTDAEYEGTPVLVGVVEGEEVNINITSIHFPSENSGKDLDMIVDATLGGNNADNYVLADITGIKGTITADLSDFEFDTDTQTITKYLGNSTSVEIPDEIFGIKVLAIGDYAFYLEDDVNGILGRSELIAVYLPDTIQTIGESAFLYTGIKSITIPKSVRTIGKSAFQQCLSLTTVEFESGSECTSIGEWAFSYTPVTDIRLPDGVTVIPFAAFAFCTSESTFTVGKNITELAQSSLFLAKFTAVVFEERENDSVTLRIGQQAMAGLNIAAIEIPSFCTYIGGACFQNAGTLKTVTFAERTLDLEWGAIPQDVTNYVFTGTNVSSIVIPGAIKSVGSGLFVNTPSLTSVTIEEGVERIESYAFQGTSITSLYLPASLKYVGFAAFNECKLLTSLTMADEGNDIVFDQWAFARVGLTEVNITKRIVVIAYACFAFASDVEQVNISAEGNTLTFTGCDVFFAANKINSVILPARVAMLPEEDDDPENGRAFASNQNATRV